MLVIDNSLGESSADGELPLNAQIIQTLNTFNIFNKTLSTQATPASLSCVALAVQVAVTQRLATDLIKVEPLIKSFISPVFLRTQSKIVSIRLKSPISDNKGT